MKKQQFIKAIEQYNKALAYKKDYTPAPHNLLLSIHRWVDLTMHCIYLQRMICCSSIILKPITMLPVYIPSRKKSISNQLVE